MKNIRNIKVISVVLLAAMLFTVYLAGCGSAPAPSTPSTSPSGAAGSDGSTAETSDSKNVAGNVNFFYWGSEQKDMMETICENFTKEYPNIKVKTALEPSEQFWTKMITSIATGQPAADVFWINPTYAVQLMNANQLVPVQDLYDSGAIDKTKFTEAAIKSYTNREDGKIYGVPKDFQTVCLIYNKGIFDEVGLSYPGDDYTWDQMVSDAQKIMKKDGSGKVTRYGFAHNASTMSSWYVYSYTNGGNVFDPDANGGKYVDTPENREAFQKAADLTFKYQVTPNGQTVTEITSDEMFTNEMVAMTAYVPAQIENYSKVLGDKVGIAGFPYMKQKATITNCLGYGIAAGTKNLETAQIFLTYLASQKGQEPQAQALIPAYQGIESEMQKKFSDMNFKIYIDAGAYAVPTPVEKYTGNQSRQILDTEVSNILFGRKDVPTALADAETQIIAAVDKAKAALGK